MSQVKFKTGAASFYVVAFSTLILLIIVASFTALVIAQITRSSNADLAQSAYDSALAGVEDAKLAFYNYQKCLAQGETADEGINDDGVVTCGEIIYAMDNPDKLGNLKCDVVSFILGRGKLDEDGGIQYGPVTIEESSEKGNNMSQAYTCATITTELGDYRATLSKSQPIKAVRPRFDGVEAKNIKKIRVSWGPENNSETQVQDSSFYFNNIVNGEVVFGSGPDAASNPATISVAILQTGESFNTDDFDKVYVDENGKNGKTDRSMVYLVPTGDVEVANKTVIGNYHGIYVSNPDTDVGTNLLSKGALVKSNDRSSESSYDDETYQNVPYVVYCEGTGDLACSVEIELPEPVSGERSDNTFVVVVGLPYGGPETTFSLEFFCKEGMCGKEIVDSEDGESTINRTQAVLKGMQIGVDVTGRANDLFRRVETRLEANDDWALSIMGPLELTGSNDGNSVVLEKNMTVKCEYDFDSPEACK